MENCNYFAIQLVVEDDPMREKREDHENIYNNKSINREIFFIRNMERLSF